MARAIKWQLPFKSLNGTDYAVNIYEEDYTGDVITLRGSSNPFSTTEDDDDDYFKPVRTQSGYIRIVYSDVLDADVYDWRDLIPDTNTSHYVELVSGTNVEWCGYMKAEQYDHSMYDGVSEYEFPVICPLTILEGYTDIVDSDSDVTSMLKFETVHEMLYELLSAAQVDFSGVYFQGNALNLPQLFCVVNKSNWMEGNGDYDYRNAIDDSLNYLYKGKSNYLEILEDICKLFGWSLHIGGKNLYFMAPDDEGRTLYEVDWDSLEDMTTDNIDTSPRVQTIITSLTYRSDQHDETYIKGARSVEITADVNKMGALLELPFSDFKIDYGNLIVTEYYNPDNPAWEHYMVFRVTKDKAWNANEKNFRFKNCQWNNIRNGSNLYDDLILRYDYTLEDYNDKKIQSVSFDNVLMLCTSTTAINSGSTITYESNEEVYVDNGFLSIYGAFAASSPTASEREDESPYPLQPDTTVQISLCIGNYWYTGSGWSTAEQTFPVTLKYGKILLNMNITQLLNVQPSLTAGHLIQIDSALHGRVKLKVVTPLLDQNGDAISDKYGGIKCTGLSVAFGIRAASDKGKEDTRYYQFISSSNSDDKSVSLNLHTYNANVYGRSYLLNSDYQCATTFAYNDDKTERPEVRLLRRMATHYETGTMQQKLDVMYNARMQNYPLVQYETDGKTFAITAIEHDWVDDNVTLTLQDTKLS